MVSNKGLYRQLCKQQQLPLFLNDWWLDAVCVEGPWDAAVIEEGGDIRAVLPYYKVKGKLGHTYLTMPRLTQFMGPWLIYPPDQKYSSKLSYEKQILAELIRQLPSFDSFTQNFHYSVTNWLPFYWESFQQSTGYTYRLEELGRPEALFAGFKSSIRREIRKAEKQVSVKVDNDIEKFYHMVGKTYKRQELTLPVSLDFMKRIDTACEANNCRRILFALDSSGRVHAALYVVWDDQSAYHLLSGGDPRLRTSGATSLLMWHAIRFAASVTGSFDFEGSMVQPIERFFSSFGSIQKPYLQLEKVNSRFLKLKKCLNAIRR
jgi:hypothetical protein